MIPILAWRALNAAIADATLNRSSSRLRTCGPVIWNPPMMLVEYAEATRGVRGACQAPTPFWRLGCYRATSQPAADFQGPLRSTQSAFSLTGNRCSLIGFNPVPRSQVPFQHASGL